MDYRRLFSARSAALQESLIRRVFEEARGVRDPINLTIGQPDFAVPEAVKSAAIEAIRDDRNGYSSNPGIDLLVSRIIDRIRRDVGWKVVPHTPPPERMPDDSGLIVTVGTSGALVCAALALLDPGDEIIIPDPYFVVYPRLGELCGARAVECDTYPDFRMTAARVEPLITPRTKAVLINSPSNPCGVVLTEAECRDLLDLCRRRNVLLISDEIYDEFTYTESRTSRLAGAAPGDRAACPSPCRVPGARECCLLVRGFGKTYGPTGWRLGYVAGPGPLIERMLKFHQHMYVCAPTPLQYGVAEAFGVDMSGVIADYERRRDLVHTRLSVVTDVPRPGGAFYAFVKVPDRLRLTASQFKDRARDRRVLVVPGAAFSARDTHFRISYATREDKLREGLDVLCELLAG